MVRRFADRPAGHRDPGQRRVGLYSDQRDFDHRRPDLPRDRSVLSGHSPGGERRHLGQPRGFVGADQGDEDRRRPDQGRAGAVPRNGGLREVRLRPRRLDPEDAGARRTPDRAVEAAAIQALRRRRAGGRDLCRHPRLSRSVPDRARRRVPGGAALQAARELSAVPRRYPQGEGADAGSGRDAEDGPDRSLEELRPKEGSPPWLPSRTCARGSRA